MESDDSNCTAKPDACNGRSSRCVYAWGNEPELYVCGFTGDIKTLDDIFCMALRLCGMVSVIFFIGCVFFGKYLMLIFTNESVLIGYGVSYLKIAGCSYLLTGISQCYLVIMKTSEHAKTTAIISSFTVCVNIILNWIFIYGAFGLEAMGVKGAALATLVARILELGCSIVISYKDGYIHPDMKRLFYRNKQLAKDFQKCALPLLGACLFWGIGFTSYSSFMGHLGVNAAAANSVAAVVRDIICCFSAGISSAAGIMVGNELGAGNLKRGKLYGIRLLKISLVCGVMASFDANYCTDYSAFRESDSTGSRIFKRYVWSDCLLHDRAFGQ